MNKNKYGFIIDDKNILLYDFIHNDENRKLIMYEIIGFHRKSIFAIRHGAVVLEDSKLIDEQLTEESKILEFLNMRKTPSSIGAEVKEGYIQIDNSKSGFHFDDELKSVYGITDDIEEKIMIRLFNNTMNVLTKEYGAMIRRLNFGGR